VADVAAPAAEHHRRVLAAGHHQGQLQLDQWRRAWQKTDPGEVFVLEMDAQHRSSASLSVRIESFAGCVAWNHCSDMALGRRRVSRILVTLVLALSVAGCFGGSPRAGAPRSSSGASPKVTSSSARAACFGQPADARPVTIPTADGGQLTALEMGRGTKGVLLVPEAGSTGKCGWMSYATELAGKGMRVLTFDMPCHGGSSCPSTASSSPSGPSANTGSDTTPGFGDEGVVAVDAALDVLRADGAASAVVVGASAGATTALAAEVGLAATTATGAKAVVALSADELGNLTDNASTIYVPTLMAVADGDKYVATTDERKLFDGLGTPASIKTLDVRPSGAGHGWDLLADPGFKNQVTAFITAQLATDYTVWGTGSRTVVLSNESDQHQTSWQAYAAHLVNEGYRVVMWDYESQDPVTGLTAMVADVRAHGAGPVFLMGASKGGKTTLVAAADLKPPAAGVVTLSAEARLAGGVDVSPYVKRLTCPLLLLTAAQDGYGSADAAKTFQADIPNLAHTLTYDGSDHGTALLYGVHGSATIPAIDAFLKAH